MAIATASESANVQSAERDFWEAYEQVIPFQRHKAVGKETGKTNYIEPSGSLEFNSRACLTAHSAQFNCTMRQRISRLVRKTLSFSKQVEKGA